MGTSFVTGQRVTAAELDSVAITLITSTVITANTSSISFTVPAGYNRLRVCYGGKGTQATTAVSAYVQFNGDTGSNYHFIYTQSNNGATSTADNASQAHMLVGTMTAATSTASFSSSGSFVIDNAGSGSLFATVVGTATGIVTGTNMYNGCYSGQWNSTAAITSIALFPSAGSWALGCSFSLYGLS